jgi:hypothetical protein
MDPTLKPIQLTQLNDDLVVGNTPNSGIQTTVMEGMVVPRIFFLTK